MSRLCKLSCLLLAALVLTLVTESSSAAATAGAGVRCADTCAQCREVCDVIGIGAGFNCAPVSHTNSTLKTCRCNTTPPTNLPKCEAKPGAAPVMSQGILLGGICLTTALMNLYMYTS